MRGSAGRVPLTVLLAFCLASSAAASPVARAAQEAGGAGVGPPAGGEPEIRAKVEWDHPNHLLFHYALTNSLEWEYLGGDLVGGIGGCPGMEDGYPITPLVLRPSDVSSHNDGQPFRLVMTPGGVCSTHAYNEQFQTVEQFGGAANARATIEYWAPHGEEPYDTQVLSPISVPIFAQESNVRPYRRAFDASLTVLTAEQAAVAAVAPPVPDGAGDAEVADADPGSETGSTDELERDDDPAKFIEDLKAIQRGEPLTGDQLRLWLELNVAQTKDSERAYLSMILLELLFSDAESPDAPAEQPPVSEQTSAEKPPADEPAPADEPSAEQPEAEPDAATGVTNAAAVETEPDTQTPLPPQPPWWMGNIIAAAMNLTELSKSPPSYDALENLFQDEGDGSRLEADSPSGTVPPPKDPPPKMKPKWQKPGPKHREWVSLGAEHEVQKLVSKVDPDTKKRRLSRKGLTTLKTDTYYQLRDTTLKNGNKVTVFYDASGRPLGAAGERERPGLDDKLQYQ